MNDSAPPSGTPRPSAGGSSAFAEVTDVTAPEGPYPWKPRIDIGESASAYILVAEMPGVRSEHLNLIYDQGYLTIEAQAPAKGYHDWQKVLQDERAKGSCYRVFSLPTDIDLEGRREKLHQGVLTIYLPKALGAGVRLDPSSKLETATEREFGQPRASEENPSQAGRSQRTSTASEQND